MKNILVLFSMIVFLFSCGSKEEKKAEVKKAEEKTVNETAPLIGLNDVAFMEGTWIDASGTMPGFHEKWVRTSDTLFQIVGYFVNGKDTAIMEAIKVKMIHGNLHYIPKIEDQNNGAEIPYELGKGSTKDSLIFFNSNHDFPQIINYVKKTNDSILVYLSGMGEDKKPVNYTLQLRRK